MNRIYLTKQVRLFLFIIISCLTFNACEDEIPGNIPTIDPDNPDQYVGELRSIELKAETEKLTISDTAICYMTAPNDSIISRKCFLEKDGDRTIVKLEVGLTDGIYRLLYFEYQITVHNENENQPFTMQYGLGCRIEVKNNKAYVIDTFDKTMQMTGSGTEDDPYIVTCGPHLYNLTLDIKDFYEYDKFNGAYFKQVANISLHDASYYCKHEEGWTPIGTVDYPFVGYYDGGNHSISNMYCYHDNLCGVGLFGHITNSSIQNLTIKNADIRGAIGVGGIAGCLMSISGERTTSSIINCKVIESTIKASQNGFAVGGLAGIIDMHTVGLIENCQSKENSITADYNAGGIIGSSSAYSLTSIDLCENSSTVQTNYSGAGGIIGVADTLSITTSNNSGTITGAKAYTGETENTGRGTGGICGGSGVSYISGCTNSGDIYGYEGVGGIIGSTRLAFTETNGALYNNTYLRYCSNSGAVSAESSHVGGLCGEAQFGCIGSINEGAVTGNDHVGGIAGHTSLSVIHHTINTGEINGRNYTAGISALSNSGVYANCQNYGEIISTGSHSAGIIGLSGNNTMIHYCSNHNKISGTNSPVGGIVGEIGDPREWSDINIAEVVFGCLEIVASAIGPICAIVEEAKELGKAAKYIMKLSELTFDGAVKIGTTVLWGYGVDHLANPHHIETLEASIKAEFGSRAKEIMTKINNTRQNSKQTIDSFSSEVQSIHSQNIVDLSNSLIPETGADETNNENFNNRINDKIYERAEKIEKKNENKEIIYTALGAVSLVATTVCTICATVFSGGVAAGFIFAGTVVGVAGGAMSISKGATDYTDNVIIISQCVNYQEISCSNISDHEVGGIIGRVHDRGLLHDCLNTGEFPDDGAHLIGRAGNDIEIKNSLSLKDKDLNLDYMVYKGGANSIYKHLYYYSDKDYNDNPYATPLTIDMIANPNSYKGWDINGDSSIWSIPSVNSGKAYPIPFKSEMTIN